MAGSPPTMLWLKRGEEALPADRRWLAPGEATRLAGYRFPKRRVEYLLRRLVVKHAVAIVRGLPTDPESLAAIEVANGSSGAPCVLIDGNLAELDVSVTDRAGWAACVLGRAVGCDMELVEPRSLAFRHDYLTTTEQQYVADGPEPDFRSNLVWSAKESALKVLGAGLRRDTRSVEVAAGEPGPDGWGPLSIRDLEAGGPLFGWWRRDGEFVFTVAAVAPGGPPVNLDRSGRLATAVPHHSWIASPAPAPGHPQGTDGASRRR